MSCTTDTIIDYAYLLDMGANEWAKHGRLRIYLKTGDPAFKVFLECRGEPERVTGFTLVTMEDGHHPRGERKRALQAHYRPFFLAGVAAMWRGAELADIPEGERPQVEEAREMIAEALSRRQAPPPPPIPEPEAGPKLKLVVSK